MLGTKSSSVMGGGGIDQSDFPLRSVMRNSPGARRAPLELRPGLSEKPKPPGRRGYGNIPEPPATIPLLKPVGDALLLL